MIKLLTCLVCVLIGYILCHVLNYDNKISGLYDESDGKPKITLKLKCNLEDMSDREIDDLIDEIEIALLKIKEDGLNG